MPAATKKPTARRMKAGPARDQKALALRRSGVGLEVIAKQLGFRGRDDAFEGCERALEATLDEPADDARRRELDRIEREIAPLWDHARAGDAAAINLITQLSVQRTRLVGAGSPLQPQFQTDDTPGAAEAATLREVERLRLSGHPLAKSALVMARFIDTTDGENAMATAAASRELRQTLSNLHAYAGDVADRIKDPQNGDGGTVVPKSRLAELRERAAARGAGS